MMRTKKKMFLKKKKWSKTGSFRNAQSQAKRSTGDFSPAALASPEMR